MISVLVSTDSRYEVNRDFIRHSAAEILKKNRIRSGKVEIGVSIVGDRRMRQLNQKYLEVGETTDVLAFPLDDVSPISSASEQLAKTGGFVRPPDKVLRLGDVVISYPQAVSQAAQKGLHVEEEIYFLLEHGVSHLLGIHHE